MLKMVEMLEMLETLEKPGKLEIWEEWKVNFDEGKGFWEPSKCFTEIHKFRCIFDILQKGSCFGFHEIRSFHVELIN